MLHLVAELGMQGDVVLLVALARAARFMRQALLGGLCTGLQPQSCQAAMIQPTLCLLLRIHCSVPQYTCDDACAVGGHLCSVL
jgi:hypothetical protein